MNAKRIFGLLLLSFFLFSACEISGTINVPGTGGNGGNNPTPENPTPDNPTPDNPAPEEPVLDSSKTYVVFQNDSSFDVDVYAGFSPYYNTAVYATVASNSSETLEFVGNVENAQTYHFVYKMNFGMENVAFPYYSSDDSVNHKTLMLEEKKANKVVIDEITKCSTKSAYILLENNSTSDIYAFMKSLPIIPYGSKDGNRFIKPNTVAAFELGDEGNILLESADYLQVVANAVEYDFPKINYEKGSVYTITVTNEGTNIKTALKGVSPFDIDVKNQIWSSTNNSSSMYIECVRSAADVKNGTLIAGSVIGDADGKKYAPGSFFVKRLDAYGKETFYKAQGVYKSSERYVYDEDGEQVLDEETEEPVVKQYNVEKSKVLDILETKDGSLLLLIQISFTEDNMEAMTNELVLYSFNPSNGEPNFVHNYTGILGEGKELIFRDGVQNRIVEIETNVFALVCGLIDYTCSVNDYVTEGLYFAKLDCTDPLSLRVSALANLPASNLEEGFESMFTSVFFDGTDFYVCGFENCDFHYNEANVHTGVIYKITGDLTSVEKIYSKDRYLFFCIDGLSNGKYFACGEEWGTVNGRLYGCYVSSEIVTANENPKRYSSISNKDYCWFNQLCAYSDRIILCGQSCDSDDGSEGSEPMVVCYNLKDEVQWENHKFTDYATAYSCFSNAIGTYNVYLYKETIEGTEKVVTEKIVSADLLGNDTGVKKVLF